MGPENVVPEGSSGAPFDEQDPRLARAVQRAVETHGSDTAELHDVVSETVVRARQRRHTPEAVIVHLKRELERGARQEMNRAEYSTLVDRVVRWCIDVYYRE